MGDTFQTLVDRDATPEDAPRLARPLVDWLVAEGIVLADAEPGWALSEHPAHPPGPHWHKAVENARWGSPEGVVVHTERHVFWSNHHDSDAPAAHCPRCATAVADHSLFSAEVDRWHGTGEGAVDCPACGVTVPIPAWNWSDDHMAFAVLGLEFWNWPWLSEAFRARISEFWPGHRTVFLAGKI
ncbi:hypothetical protein [Streptomyces antibioticus]|nr:hypothetical protein [Streptomyces antibioticus]QIT45176.1 hypothetical protein HCX60_17825 [Streptomyces antibioticus]